MREGFGISAGRQVDGLIGFEVLSRFVTTFDYAAKRVVLQMPGTATTAPNATVIPIVQHAQQPQFACTLDTVAGQCTLDTGARDSLSLYTPFMQANPQVVPAKLTAAGVNGFGFGGASIRAARHLHPQVSAGFRFPTSWRILASKRRERWRAVRCS